MITNERKASKVLKALAEKIKEVYLELDPSGEIDGVLGKKINLDCPEDLLDVIRLMYKLNQYDLESEKAGNKVLRGLVQQLQKESE